MSHIRHVAVLLIIFVVLLLSSSALAANNPVPQIVPPFPSAAAPGGAAFTLTVEGANFVSGSVVNWNGSPRTTAFVSTTKLTASILASDIATQGTATVTVTSPAPGGGVSNQEFFSIAPPASRVAFGSYSVTNQNVLSSNEVEGDFNNDGKLDIAVASGSVVYVLLGNGDGTFQSAIGTNGPASSTIEGLFAADANNDGKLDLFASGSTASTSFILTLFGKGDGTFQVPVETDFALDSGLRDSFVFADVNGDGVRDAVYTVFNQIIVLLGNADGSFRSGSTTAVNVPYHAVRVLAAGDFRGQGSMSLVLEMSDPSASTTFLAVFDTVGGLPNSSPAAYPEGTPNPFAGDCRVALADFNGDGKLDIANMHQGVDFGAPPVLNVMLNTGSTTQSSFSPAYVVPNSSTVIRNTSTLVAADFNSDGFLDLAAGGLVFFNNGGGIFPTSTGSPNPAVFSNFLLAGDFNGDGKPDIITGLDSTGGPSAIALGLLQQISPAADFLGSVSPSSATIALNGNVSYVANLQALFGFASDVGLSVSGLPAGVTGNFVPATVTHGSGSSTLALTANGSVALGTYTITVTGTGGGITHSTTFQLLVNSSVGDFTGSVTPDALNIVSGQSGVSTISIAPTGGFTGNVTLSLSGSLAPGVTFAFSPLTITGGSGTSTLTIGTPTGLPASVTQVTVTATSGTIVRCHTFPLGVNLTAGDFTGTFTGSQTSTPSGVVEYVFNLQSIGGYSQPVKISFAGLPAGVVSDGPIAVTPGSSGGVHLTLTNVALGSYPLLVTLAGPGVVHEVTIMLVVTP